MEKNCKHQAGQHQHEMVALSSLTDFDVPFMMEEMYLDSMNKVHFYKEKEAKPN